MIADMEITHTLRFEVHDDSLPIRLRKNIPVDDCIMGVGADTVRPVRFQAYG